MLYGPNKRTPLSLGVPLLNQEVGNNATIIVHRRYSILVEHNDVSYRVGYVSGQRVIQLLTTIVYVCVSHISI